LPRVGVLIFAAISIDSNESDGSESYDEKHEAPTFSTFYGISMHSTGDSENAIGSI
jgi:hypothetical protein